MIGLVHWVSKLFADHKGIIGMIGQSMTPGVFAYANRGRCESFDCTLDQIHQHRGPDNVNSTYQLRNDSEQGHSRHCDGNPVD